MPNLLNVYFSLNIHYASPELSRRVKVRVKVLRAAPAPGPLKPLRCAEGGLFLHPPSGGRIEEFAVALLPRTIRETYQGARVAYKRGGTHTRQTLKSGRFASARS